MCGGLQLLIHESIYIPVDYRKIRRGRNCYPYQFERPFGKNTRRVRQGFRRLLHEPFAPVDLNWGVNHRAVAIRIPQSDAGNLRFEHRVAGADANPYLVTAAVAAGVHYGLKNKCDPGKMVEEGQSITLKTRIPDRWEAAIEKFSKSKVLPDYLGEEFCKYYALHRLGESRQFHNVIPQTDFDYYLRAV